MDAATAAAAAAADFLGLLAALDWAFSLAVAVAPVSPFEGEIDSACMPCPSLIAHGRQIDPTRTDTCRDALSDADSSAAFRKAEFFALAPRQA